MPSKTQARLEFRLDVCFKQLMQAGDIASDMGDWGAATDCYEMAAHCKSIVRDLIRNRIHAPSYRPRRQASENR